MYLRCARRRARAPARPRSTWRRRRPTCMHMNCATLSTTSQRTRSNSIRMCWFRRSRPIARRPSSQTSTAGKISKVPSSAHDTGTRGHGRGPASEPGCGTCQMCGCTITCKIMRMRALHVQCLPMSTGTLSCCDPTTCLSSPALFSSPSLHVHLHARLHFPAECWWPWACAGTVTDLLEL